MNNPFRSDLEYSTSFCERPMEFSYLCSAATNGLNVVVSGNRGQGRSCLVGRVLDEVVDLVSGIYIPCRAASLFSSENIESGIAVLIAQGILKAFPESESRIRDELLRFDPITSVSGGQSIIEFGSSSNLRLSEVFELWNLMLSEHGKKGLIVFDDFHLVAEEKLENQLRSVIQQNSNTSHLFVIGQAKEFERWFMSSKRAFFRSGSTLYLSPIPKEEWTKFLQEKFDSIDLAVEEEVIAEILKISELHTATVMRVCSVLIGFGSKRRIFGTEVQRAMDVLVRQHRVYIEAVMDGLSRNQRSLLVALALADEPVKPYTNSFLQMHNLRSTSVQRAVPALVERELAFEDEDGAIAILDPIVRHAILREKQGRY